MLRNIRLVAWALAALFAVAGVVIWFTHPKPDGTTVQSSEMIPIGGPFTLNAADGRRFSSQRLAGKPHAIFFGFTNCPDVCPTTLARLVKLRNQLGKGDGAFEIVLISVDPERDTPAELDKYVGLFGSPVIGLTGSTAEIDHVKRLFGVYSAKAPGANGNYSVDHTATVFLMDRDGKFRATIAPDESDEAAKLKLASLAS